MVEINVYTPIGSQSLVMIGGKSFTEAVFSADSVRRLFDAHKGEEEFKFNIHCDGGDVAEGFAIYDLIRGSGKTIYTQIDGGCHSMAVILLLSAPKENRTANKNARALIHFVYAQADGMMNANQLDELKEYILQEQNKIINIYEDRTDLDRQSLEGLMSEERELTAQELLDYGFITRINPYTTNKKPTNTNFNKMAQKPKLSLKQRATNFKRELQNYFATNYEHYDKSGDFAFSTDEEDEKLNVGMPASPDGTYELEDRTVVIRDGYIESIEDRKGEDKDEVIADLENRLAEGGLLVAELEADNAKLRNQLGGKQVINGRTRTPNKAYGSPSVEDYKADMIARRNQRKGGK